MSYPLSDPPYGAAMAMPPGYMAIPSPPPSSPPPAPESRTTSRKLKKPPPITPKRFNRFFTPRTVSTRANSGSTCRAGRQLRDITQNGANRGSQLSRNHVKPERTVLFESTTEQENLPATPDLSSGRKRKGFLSPESSPIQPSPSKRARSYSPLPTITDVDEEVPSNEPERSVHPLENTLPIPIKKVRTSTPSFRVLDRSFGGLRGLGRSGVIDHCTDWQSQTANFYSNPTDSHTFHKYGLPFSAASCKTNSLIAIGFEEGNIRLIDPSRNAAASFSIPFLDFAPHPNAVMDMEFSHDDLSLATASGDQSARVIDMRTQQVKYILSGHRTSVKQVRYQPGNDQILATSSRDGSVRLWDLRYQGAAIVVDPPQANTATRATSFANIPAAHADWASGSMLRPTVGSMGDSRDAPRKGEPPSRRGDVSVTALSFLSAEREHLFLTASEASTCVKLWDIRSRYSRQGPAVPIASTQQPDSHSTHRHFGVTSIVIGGDSSRLYALSRDSTVYAYSTNHLVLGHAPELSRPASQKPPSMNENKSGLGPLYGFRHPKCHTTSFYVKAALRPASGDKPEMLAVASGDGCPVLFPTDETFLKRKQAQQDREDVEHTNHQAMPATPTFARPGLNGTRSSRFASRLIDTIPIYEHGTALVRGHEREVSGLTWTYEGDLVSTSDDYNARRWREDQQEARKLRMAGEEGGIRWNCGWAEVDESFDDEDE
ncbi:WD40 repeat-like protein [Aulographum hederae CBS 113979]|uniref:WD40 repeat-like protein n=1 Tax=Aulographum hederae CBS 113979 TaxID=1176131 RepID=A0A6G1GNR2_9PEZI|nr:WD40 repeat-like protein [Aulographum hederae CBS 113979]